MPSPLRLANMQAFAISQQDQSPSLSRRPSYSPVTPPLSGEAAEADGRKGSGVEYFDEQDPVPINLEENTDALALKAALSILQLQKQQSQRDIKQLAKMRAAAKKEPEAFIDALRVGRLSKAPPQALIHVATDGDDDDDDDDDDDNDEQGRTNKVNGSDPIEGGFGQFPNPQNVVRCPPINWAKYHVVGQSLDKLHEEQKQRPEPGSPRRDEYGRPPEHVTAAPYQPLLDKIDPAGVDTERDSKE